MVPSFPQRVAFTSVVVLSLFATTVLASPFDETTAAPYQPGSVLGFMNCWNPQTNSSTLLLTLWDAGTGNNYTTVIPGNWSWSTDPLIYSAERVLVYARARSGMWGTAELFLSFFDYAPRTAPTLSKKYKTCKMPDYALDASPFFLNGKLYAFSRRLIYYVTLPKEHEGPCGLEVAAPNPQTYTAWSAASVQQFQGQNYFSFVSYSALVVVSPRDGGVLPSSGSGSSDSYSNSAPSEALLNVAEFPITNASMQGEWNYFAQDPVTLDGFYYSVTESYTNSFWWGSAKTSTTNKNAASSTDLLGMQWTQVSNWTWALNGIQIDPRVRQYGAPIFCTSNSGFSCVNIKGAQVYSNWHFQSECPSSGAISNGAYDPYCH